MQRRRNMENIKTAMSARDGVAFGKLLSVAEHILKIAGGKHSKSVRQVSLKPILRYLCVRQCDAFESVRCMSPYLESKCLSKFIRKQRRDMQWFFHRSRVGRCRR